MPVRVDVSCGVSRSTSRAVFFSAQAALAAPSSPQPSLAAPPSLQPLTAARSYLLAAIGYWELGTDEGQEALGHWGWQEDEPTWDGYGGGGWGSWGSGSYGSDSWGKGGKGL